jgi:sugar phosphate isomerase/epimerase
MHHEHQRIKKEAGARKVADELKRHALEAEELGGLSAVNHCDLYGGADSEQRFGAFVVAALAQLARRVGELENQLETLKQHTDTSEFDEGMISQPPDEKGVFS